MDKLITLEVSTVNAPPVVNYTPLTVLLSAYEAGSITQSALVDVAIALIVGKDLPTKVV